MGLIGIIAGLILLLAGSDWFSGAGTVGVILLVVGGVLLAIQVLWTAFVASKVKRQFNELDRYRF